MTAVIDAPALPAAFLPSVQAPEIALQIMAIRADGHDIRVFDLYPDAGRRLPAWTPGAHIQLALPGGMRRSYSLCNASGDSGFYRIAVKREAASRGGSAWLHEQAQIGAQLMASAPVNAFPLEETDHPVALFAAGIGITPLYAMAFDLLSRGRRATLHYFARSAGHAALLPELAHPMLAPHCHYCFGLSAGETTISVAQKLRDLPRTTPLYVCGPAPFIALVREQARLLGWNDASVHFELFAAPAAIASVAHGAPPVDAAFELVLQRSGVRCMVPPGQSIVAAAAQAGVTIGTSCGEGFCGSCRSAVLDGVPDHRDSVLSAQEHAANQYLMPCVSRCRGERLVLDL